MNQLKDILGQAWGFCLSTLLPGLALSSALSYWLSPLRDMLQLFMVEAKAMQLLLILMGSTICGLLLSLVTWMVYEIVLFRVLLLKRIEPMPLEFSEKYAQYQWMIKEPYRHFQFVGGMSLVLPLFYWRALESGLVVTMQMSFSNLLVALLAMLAFEAILISSAVYSYKRYVHRSSQLLIKENQLFSIVSKENSEDRMFGA